MTKIFKFPDIGEGMHEGEIANWLVKVGDEIKEEDPIVEIQNDKLLQEILSPYSGKITKLFFEAGDTVEVGQDFVEFDGDGSSVASSSAPAPENAPAPNGQQEDIVAPKAEANVPIIDGKVRAMPSVRKFAKEHGVSIAQVPASGKHGHVTLQDIKQWVADGGLQAEQTVLKAPGSSNPVEPMQAAYDAIEEVVATQDNPLVEKMTPIRKAIAKNMVAQKTTVPHVTLFDQVEVSDLMAHRKAQKDQLAAQGVKLTYLAYVVKAFAAVGKKFPAFNAHVDMVQGVIVHNESVNIGIAVDTPKGLFVPVIKHAESKSIVDIAKEVETLASAARDGKLTPAQSSGATMTISNIGSARGNWFTPVINQNESVILGMGSIVKEPIVNSEGELAVGQNMKLSLSFDHRLIDGMLAQSGMNALKAMLGDLNVFMMEV
jgi:pyruvate dehydrogenase E2 component (dihydrolipoamide acetyltransferase)